MISWLENTDFEVDRKKQKTLPPVEKTSDLRSYVGGINIILSLRITPEGQLMKKAPDEVFPKLLQAV